MKIEFIKEQLEEALSKADKIAGKNLSLPVLSGFYLEAKNKFLTIKATNLDLGISINIPVKVIEEGAVVTPAHILSSFISSLAKERSATFTTKDQLLLIETPKTKTSLKTLPSDEFPIIPDVSEDNAFSMPVKDFIQGVRSVIYSSSIGSVKPELSSIAVTYDNDYLVFAATDSFRLAEKKIKVRKIPHFKQILIPQKNALEIVRIFDKTDEDMSISISDNQIGIRCGGVYVTSRIIEGVFPDYKQIIPKDKKTFVTLLKQDLINSLKTSLIFSDSFNQLTIKAFPKNKLIELDSKNSSIGESNYKIDAILEGDDIEINVNHKYFTDCFQSIPVDTISISFIGQAKPIVMRGVGDNSFLYLVMPMNQS